MKIDFGIKPVGVVDDVFGDDISKVELYDFSQANLDSNHRLHAITSVASICYQNPKSIDNKSLYNRLECESKGLPSSSFEFVPVLISETVYMNRVSKDMSSLYNPITKFGIWIKDMGKNYLLTNYRAVVSLFELTGIDIRDIFNTKEECTIISRYFFIFKLKIDTNTRTQLIRHRMFVYQELSRRYVSDKKVPFLFYISKKMKNIISRYIHKFEDTKSQTLDFTTEDVHNICLNHYNASVANGVKPQEARRIIPQSMYTDIWAGSDVLHFNSFLKLRKDSSAQFEIRAIAIAMEYLITTISVDTLKNNITLIEGNLKKVKELSKELTDVKEIAESENYVVLMEKVLNENIKKLENCDIILESKGYIK